MVNESLFSHTTYKLRQVLGTTVALGNRGIPAPEHSGNGTTDNVAATEYDSIATRNLDTRVIQELDNTSRSAGSEKRLRSARRQVTDVVCVEAWQFK